MKIQLICCLLIGSLSASAQHTIKGEVKGTQENFTVYLKKFEKFDWVVLDSAMTHKNKFEFKLLDNGDLLYLDTPSNPSFYIKLYNETGTTKVSYDLNTHTYTLKGTEKNEGLSAFNTFMQPYHDELKILSQQKPKISNRYQLTEEEREKYQQHFFLEKAFKQKMELAKFEFIKKNKGNTYTNALIEEKLKSNFTENEYDLLKGLYNDLTLSDKQSENGQKLATFLKEYELVVIGAKLDDFTLNDVHNKPQSLKKNLGKYTIIDFWASWCAPCPKENPHVVTMYNKYKDRGLNIIGISLDDNKDRWVNAIEKDQLTWLQLSNLKGWEEPLLKILKVTSIPKTIIVDKNGVIVAKDLRGESLEDKLAELFD